MTPERKEVIKEDAQYEVNAGYGHGSSDISNQEALELLAALEETEQQAKGWKEISVKQTNELVEAQHNISRLTKALERIMNVTGADYEESFNKAINIAYLALGLGEGAKTNENL